MATKAKVNLGGSEPVEVEFLNFETVKESDWIDCKLEDGNHIAVKTVITKVIKAPAKDPITGDPVYYVLTSNVVRVVSSGD
jgi:hypothetical protein